jgi:hypothetical protein
MALTLENINQVKQRARHETRGVGAAEGLRSLWKHMESLGNPDLQFVPFDQTDNAETVIADVPCKIFAIYFKKPAASTTAAWLKLTDEASAGNEAHADISFKQAAAVGAKKEFCVVFHDGFSMASGAMIVSHTANDGNTDSNDADAAAGFCIIGAA